MSGANDLLLATHARSQGLTLVTNNAREFGRVSHFVLENWATGSQEHFHERVGCVHTKVT
jgi:tRNA(fMet)-specific endonuclease VapC